MKAGPDHKSELRWMLNVRAEASPSKETQKPQKPKKTEENKDWCRVLPCSRKMQIKEVVAKECQPMSELFEKRTNDIIPFPSYPRSYESGIYQTWGEISWMQSCVGEQDPTVPVLTLSPELCLAMSQTRMKNEE